MVALYLDINQIIDSYTLSDSIYVYGPKSKDFRRAKAENDFVELVVVL